jgi:hypothetical protein
MQTSTTFCTSIRGRFGQRFTARRMALEYVDAYRSMMGRDVHRLKLVVDRHRGRVRDH